MSSSAEQHSPGESGLINQSVEVWPHACRGAAARLHFHRRLGESSTPSWSRVVCGGRYRRVSGANAHQQGWRTRGWRTLADDAATLHAPRLQARGTASMCTRKARTISPLSTQIARRRWRCRRRGCTCQASRPAPRIDIPWIWRPHLHSSHGIHRASLAHNQLETAALTARQKVPGPDASWDNQMTLAQFVQQQHGPPSANHCISSKDN